eukprot:TRINITY_DN796_c0_g1_i1.p1 TRINITY_DN796_c0_g1~~TRINITY_DN796_c0_g1_i1.p1  ORF type:complete len:84 (-),score=11.49 TRINITY_DN796_c0_g1_i1:185-436(-)
MVFLFSKSTLQNKKGYKVDYYEYGIEKELLASEIKKPHSEEPSLHELKERLRGTATSQIIDQARKVSRSTLDQIKNLTLNPKA